MGRFERGLGKLEMTNVSTAEDTAANLIRVKVTQTIDPWCPLCGADSMFGDHECTPSTVVVRGIETRPGVEVAPSAQRCAELTNVDTAWLDELVAMDTDR